MNAYEIETEPQGTPLYYNWLQIKVCNCIR